MSLLLRRAADAQADPLVRRREQAENEYWLLDDIGLTRPEIAAALRGRLPAQVSRGLIHDMRRLLMLHAPH